jgi:hypothetical protein
VPGSFQLGYFHARLYRHSVCLVLEWEVSPTELDYTGARVGVHSRTCAGL